jgi:excisionase family DNA binding protein
VPDELSAKEAAALLNTTRPTVLGLIENGELKGRKEPRGQRFRWRITRASVTASIEKHGTFPRRGDGRTGRLNRVEDHIASLRAEVADLAKGRDPDERSIIRERDDLRATVVAFTDALARMRSAAELRDRAEEERAAMVRHLGEAVAAGERADDLRRAGLRELEEAVTAAVQPGHPGALAM